MGEGGDDKKGADGARPRATRKRGRYSGLLDLHARHVFRLFRCNEISLREFRTSRTDHVALDNETAPILASVGDLLLRREERDRFELQSGLSSSGPAVEKDAFIASADYREVRCDGCHFRLGPIQARVVRALRETALAGEPWRSGKAVLSSAGSRSLRMADLFKSQKEWRRLIRSDHRGCYRLNID